MIKINEDSLEKALAEQMREVHMDQALVYRAEANYVRKGKGGIEDVLSNFTRDIEEALRLRTGGIFDISNEVGEAILRGEDDVLKDLLKESQKQTTLMKDPMKIEGMDTQLDRFGTKLENANTIPEDITDIMGEYAAEYNQLAAEERAYSLAMTQSNIYAVGSEKNLTSYKGLSLTAQNVGTGWVNDVESRGKDTLKTEYDLIKKKQG